MKQILLTDRQREKADFIRKSPIARFSSLLDHQVKDLAITWCYYSGRIEGNPYSHVETESLLKDGITYTRRYEDAKMLKNLYNTFISCAEMSRKEGQIRIDRFTVNSIHSMLMDDLLPNAMRGTTRTMPVRITGTSYIPPQEPEEISECLDRIIQEQAAYEDPLERAIFLHCNIAKLQPFVDGNKRTSRVLESAVLMSADIIPVRSDKSEDIENYRKTLVHYYETEDLQPYIEYMLGVQIDRINELTPAKKRFYPGMGI